MLTVCDLSVSYGRFQALRSVSLQAAPGSILGLIGPNGSGKSTFLNVIAGVQAVASGEVRLDGTLVPLGLPERVAAHGIGRSFQTPRLAHRLTVFQNIMIGARPQAGERLRSLFLQPATVRRREADIQDEARSVLRRLDLSHKANDYAGMLSGGQQKLLSLGMLLMGHPRVLLLDEPAAGVNPVLIERQINLLKELRAEGRIILLVEHNMEMVCGVCDRVVVLDSGAVIAEGDPDAIRRDERVMRSYLGEPA
ncbi:ABC transporter ATP-binding protein [Acidisoma silvae]|uniref:ABC transporter ATP-binding protein n=1 Tax=Acidisoma silvae TaxID=2802396 RepID=A0A963YVN0_9PROT|nr:ABC transporter ATP-binding protein [Acidisoma silvae]MCB8878062.1 ABC transporter ATP-binding protein [Acidisoma silvae]